jgi:hypothetical protein
VRTELKRHLLKYSVFGCMVLGLHSGEKCCGVGAGMRAVACAVVGAVARCWCVRSDGFKPAAPPPCLVVAREDSIKIAAMGSAVLQEGVT